MKRKLLTTHCLDAAKSAAQSPGSSPRTRKSITAASLACVLALVSLYPAQAPVAAFNQDQPIVSNPSTDYVLRKYPNAVVHMTLNLIWGPFDVTLIGPARDTLLLQGPNGEAEDHDGDGLDDVHIGYPMLSLSGDSKYGPVTLWISPYHPVWGPLISYGGIEELVNATPGILDVPPYTTVGSANGYLELYVAMDIQDLYFGPYNRFWTKYYVRLEGEFDHSAPQPGDTYYNMDSYQLYNEWGEALGLYIVNFDYTPRPAIYQSTLFTLPLARVKLGTLGEDVDASLFGTAESLLLTGEAGEAYDPDEDNLDQVLNILTALDFNGNSSLGPLHLRLRPFDKSPFRGNWGQIEERENPNRGILDLPPFIGAGLYQNRPANGYPADSFFDIFFEIEINGELFHNEGAYKMQAVLSNAVPRPGENYQHEFEIELYDEDNNSSDISIVELMIALNPYVVLVPVTLR